MDGQSFGDEFDWPTLAAHAGDVGRFIWYLDSAECEIDLTLQRMTHFKPPSTRFAASEFIDQIHFEDQSLVWLAVNEALVTGNSYNVEFRFVRSNGKVIWLAGLGRLTQLPGGGQAILGVNRDITEQRNLMERFELVAGEMEHRVKNLLTVVSSIYRSSARRAESVEALTGSFLPRLVALASLNGLAARSGHREIDVDALVEAVLQPVTGRNITRQIESLEINPTMAQVLTLMLNELMTNAVKYGGLADSEGRVTVDIATQEQNFILTWQEFVPYDLPTPVRPDGFGMEVLKNLSAATFAGRPELIWNKDGLVFRCIWPLDKVAVL